MEDNIVVTSVELRSDIRHLAEAVKEDFARVNARLDTLSGYQREQNGAVAVHETRITVLETFCRDMVKPAVQQVTENRISTAVIAAKAAQYGGAGFGIGGGIAAVAMILAKAWGLL